ncbi:MAG: phthiocerol/phthiodiolone dimycocerosyl transferase family protein [Segniliparus sp.]|uniref:phthiocerol/phthiodiolone dimycocerosyl transferase family protein n=1 Tax=Segniliparus sp. TaxID=2804064 RepID=UPI003F3A2828
MSAGVKAAMPETSLGAEFRRPLSPLESWFALSAMTIWYTVEVEGPVDVEALREALRLLRLEHPVLTGRFVPGRSGRTMGLPDLDLVVPGGSEVVVREGGQGPVRADHSKELAFLDVARNGSRTSVSFVVHHSIGDGKLGAHWHALLWSHYTDLVEGRAPTVEPHPVPRPPEDLLVEHGVEKAAGAPERLRAAIPTDLPDPEGATFTRGRIKLSQEQTALLHARAQALGSTVHALVAGACAVVERRRMQLPDDLAVDLYIDSPVDIRSWLGPAAETWDVTNALGSSPGVVSALPDSDPVALGALLRAQLREDLSSGAVCQGVLRFAEILVTDQQTIPRITTSNMGVMEPVRTPPSLQVHDFRGWVEFDGGAIAEYLATAAAGRYNRFSSLYLIYTYDGRLSVDLGLPFAAETARAHIAEFEGLLLEIAAREEH